MGSQVFFRDNNKATMIPKGENHITKEQNWMQGWHYGKGLINLLANISANNISLPQGQSYTEGKYYKGSKNLNFKNTQMVSD